MGERFAWDISASRVAWARGWVRRRCSSEEMKAEVVSWAPTVRRKHSRRASASPVGVEVGLQEVMRLQGLD